MRQRKNRGRPTGHPAQDSQHRRGENPNQDCAIHLACHQHEHDCKPYAGELRLAIGKAAQADERCRIRHHQLGIAQPHEGDEHPNAPSGGILQAFGNSVDDLFPHARDGENQKKDARKKDNAQSGTPRNVHALANHVGEVGVQRHAWRQRDGIVCV